VNKVFSVQCSVFRIHHGDREGTEKEDKLMFFSVNSVSVVKTFEEMPGGQHQRAGRKVFEGHRMVLEG